MPAFTLGPGQEVAIYYTHADGSHSTSGSWRLPDRWPSPEPEMTVMTAKGPLKISEIPGFDVAKLTLGQAITEACLDQDVVGECGGVPFVPVVSAEIVAAASVLSPWQADRRGRRQVREVWGSDKHHDIVAAVSDVDVRHAKIDVLAATDAQLRAAGYRLL